MDGGKRQKSDPGRGLNVFLSSGFGGLMGLMVSVAAPGAFTGNVVTRYVVSIILSTVAEIEIADRG